MSTERARVVVFYVCCAAIALWFSLLYLGYELLFG